MSAHCKHCGREITDDADKHEHMGMCKSSFAAPPGSETWTCRMCNGCGGHAEGCPGESEHIQLLEELRTALSEYPQIPNEVFIGTDSDVDKVRWLARRCGGSDRTIRRLYSEKAELLMLLKSVHEWFMEKSPQNYNGCGLWIDVDAVVGESPNAEVSEGGTRDSRIETAAQSRPSLH